MAYVIGVDGGTESLRAFVFDLEGRPLAYHATPYETKFPQPSWAEQNPEDWWRALGESVRGALARHPVFRRLSRDIPTIGVPGEFWPCTGPHLIDAIDHLSAEIANLGLADGQMP